jgi:hypothetical protein
MRLLRNASIGFAVLVLVVVATVLVLQRVADGPIGPFGGGPFRTGALVSEPEVDWARVMESRPPVELQLVEPARSRVTGAFVEEGELYVPCDLGFIAHRIPRTRTRWILSLILSVKHWHEDAIRDGRVVLRIAGKRYERQAVRVTDPELLATLRSKIEAAAAAYLEVAQLPDVPADTDAIWFFRMDPRPAAQ